MSRPAIYILSAISYKRNRDCRPWAWFSTKEAAIGSAIESVDWYCEMGHYDYIVIEKFLEGYHHGDYVAWFYTPYVEGCGYHNAIRLDDTPEWAKQTCSWGLG